METKMVKKRDCRGEAWWRSVIDEQARSGESVKELCEREGVGPQLFYKWRCRFSRAEVTSFTAVDIGIVNEYEIRCRNGRSVVVRGAVNAEHLSSVLHAVEGVSR